MIRKFIEVLGDHMIEDLISEIVGYYKNFSYLEMKRLRQLMKDVSYYTLSGDKRKFNTTCRLCFLLMEANIHEQACYDCMEALLLAFPPYDFEEPQYKDVSSREIIGCKTEYEWELEEEFGVNTLDYLNLSYHWQNALLHVLRVRVNDKSCICAISCDDIFENNKLTDDIVAIFEEGLYKSNYISCNDDYIESGNEESMLSYNYFPEEHLDSFYYPNRKLRFSFTTELVDNVVESSTQYVNRGIEFVTRAMSFSDDDFTMNSFDDLSTSDSNINNNNNSINCQYSPIERYHSAPDLFTTPTSNDSTSSNSLMHSQSLPSLNSYNHPHITIEVPQRESTENSEQNIAPKLYILRTKVSKVCDSDDNTISSGSSLARIQKQKLNNSRVVVRCHLFKGKYLIKWFNQGRWINPITRNVILPEDWCRLTKPCDSDNAQLNP